MTQPFQIPAHSASSPCDFFSPCYVSSGTRRCPHVSLRQFEVLCHPQHHQLGLSNPYANFASSRKVFPVVLQRLVPPDSPWVHISWTTLITGFCLTGSKVCMDPELKFNFEFCILPGAGGTSGIEMPRLLPGGCLFMLATRYCIAP